MGLTMTEQVADDAETGVPLRRPPVRQATLVRSDITHTFKTFVSTIGTWWPLQPMSVGGEKARDARIEPRVGGSVVEIWDDGSTVEWGRVGAWEPPHRFVMSWTAPGGYRSGAYSHGWGLALGRFAATLGSVNLAS